jgi:hypothetical protein
MSAATPIPIPTPRRELAHRKSGGLEITLYWDAEHSSSSTTVEVHQPATKETISIPVAEDQALDAFHHPFAYIGRANDYLAA